MKPTTTSASRPLAVGFISLGCAKNLVDSQVMAGSLVENRISLAASPEEADVIIVNTCAFIEDAREESVDTILSACNLKDEGVCRAVIVAGCMPQRYREELHESLPEVDAFIGLDELDQIPNIVTRLAAGEDDIYEVSDASEKLFEPPEAGVVFTGGPFAYLKIAEGCNHGCAFCAIPGIRGRYRSRTVEHVVAEAEQLLGAGFRELNIISQDVMSYGRDLRDGTTLVALLRALAEIGGDFWIRLLYGYPTGVTDELLETMAGIPQVCHYLDVPIQHSDPEVLQLMRRPETIDAVSGMVEHARRVMPDIALRTTCLVGFPGETEAHFDALLRSVDEAKFDHLGAFVFSPEEDTPAFTMADCPPRAVSEERRERLLLAQQDVVAARAAKLVGTTARVLLEQPGADAEVWEARSARQAPEVDGQVFVANVPDSGESGQFVDVRYTAVSDYDMEAEMV